MVTVGIDIGSTTSKCVVMQDGKRILGSALIKGGAGTQKPEMAYELALENAGIKEQDIGLIISTGYGRSTFEKSDANLSELTCHAKGVYFTAPGARTIIDIGGQDVKVMSLNANGKMKSFLMNDKCAAGTGRFLDVMAGILQVSIEDLEVLASKSHQPASISSTCTVFAESEVISQMARGIKLEDIARGICESVAKRVAALSQRIGIEEQVYMSGGVAKNGGVRNALERSLNKPVLYHEDAQYMGAIGAALSAYERLSI